MSEKRVDLKTVSLPGVQRSFNQFRMTVLRGADTGRAYESTSEECSIGTLPGNQLVLNDSLVSGHHCVIRASADGVMLVDLGSTNGTRIGGLRVEAAFLAHGLTVEIGESVLRFEVLEERISPALSDSNQVGGLFGVSAAMRQIFAIVERVAASDVPVLLEGETGVGKTALAELIHSSSSRADEPLVITDLTTLSVGHMESALFGPESSRGAFARAGAGTLVVKEIGQLPLPLQSVLLAALERGEYEGADGTILSLGARLVVTEQSDLREAVNSKRFRSDLFYRLSAIKLRVPPLRERREDIPPLVERFYASISKDADPAPPAELLERLFWRPWPGNVRELRAAVERAAVIADPELWLADDSAAPVGFDFDANASYRESKDRVVGQFERWYAAELIRRHGGNLSRAARAARMDRSYLRELLRRHEIPLPSKSRSK